jgi:hypothetical protein
MMRMDINSGDAPSIHDKVPYRESVAHLLERLEVVNEKRKAIETEQRQIAQLAIDISQRINKTFTTRGDVIIVHETKDGPIGVFFDPARGYRELKVVWSHEIRSVGEWSVMAET